MTGEVRAAREGQGSGSGRIVFASFVFLGMAVLFATAWALRNLLLFTFLSLIFGVLLHDMSARVTRWTGLGTPWSVFLVLLVVVGLVAAAFLLVVPTVLEQGRELIQRLPGAVDAAQERLGNYPLVTSTWEQVKSQLTLPSPSAAVAQVGGVIALLGSTIGYLVLVFFTALFLALSPETYVNGTIRLLPVRHRAYARDLFSEVGQTMRSWFGGQLVMMTGVGLMAWLGLWALGIPYSLALGVFAGLLDFVPYLGPILGAAPAVLIAFSVSPAMAGWTVLLFFVVQQIEGNVMQPVIQKSAAEIPPALLLIVLFGMGEILGLPGLIVATPLAAVMLVVVRRVYVEQMLEGGKAPAHSPEK